MSIKQEILLKLHQLPVEQQKQVLEFVNALHKEYGPKKLPSLEGLWEDLNLDITEEDIAQARKEMWGGFPRNIE